MNKLGLAITIVVTAAGCSMNSTSHQEVQLLNQPVSQDTKGFVIHQNDQGIYIGEMLEGQPNGQGTWYLKDKIIYTGNWKNGALEGSGTAIHVNTDTLTYGEFTDGSLNGDGYFYQSGNGYYGKFKQDMPVGPGTCITSGQIAECEKP